VSQRNPYEPPSSTAEVNQSQMLDSATTTPVRLFVYRTTTILFLVWLALCPFLWWRGIALRFGVQVPIEHLVQPIMLACIGVGSLPGLWRFHRRLVIALEVAVLSVALSLLAFQTTFVDGVLFNAAVLSGIGIYALLSSKSPHVARKA